MRSMTRAEPTDVRADNGDDEHEPSEDPRRRLGGLLSLNKAGVFYALFAIVLAFEISTTATGKPGYLTIANAENVLQQASIAGVIAIFATVVLITGNFDLSVASTAGLSACLALRLIDVANPALVIALCLAVGAVVGAVNGLLVVYRRINAFIVTLGTLTIVRGLVVIAAGETAVVADAAALQPLSTGTIAFDVEWVAGGLGAALLVWVALRHRSALARWPALPLAVSGAMLVIAAVFVRARVALNHSVYIELAIGVVVWLVMRKTVLGRRLYAVGSNTEAARLAGVPVREYQFGAFVASGLGAAFAGLMLAGLYQSADPTIFTGQELIIITAAVIGGTSLFGGSGDVMKTVVGMIVLAAVTNGMNFQALSAAWQSTVQGSILILAAAVYTAQGSGGRRPSVGGLVRRRSS